MQELDSALAQLLAVVPSPRSEQIPIEQAHRRVLAEDIVAPLDLPGFDNSAMDGFAVRSADVASACKESPTTLKVTGRVAAGDRPAEAVESGCCVRVFTGSPMPRGADAVVMQEDTLAVAGQADLVSVLDRVAPGENVRHQGEDVKCGAVVAARGERLRSNQVALLAAVGLGEVNVGRRPTVGLLSTGSELRSPGERLAPGQIYESNRLALSGLVEDAGGESRVYPLVRDTFEETREALERAFAECDAVVSSGGVSVGEMDFIRAAFEAIGGHLEFWRVSIKPGRPFVLGRLREKLLFGLPGNPVSAFVTFLLLVRPALLKWQGARDLNLPEFSAELGETLSNAGNRRQFTRVKRGADGRVYSAGLQGSHCLSSLAQADGLVSLPAETTLEQGATVRVLFWE